MAFRIHTYFTVRAKGHEERRPGARVGESRRGYVALRGHCNILSTDRRRTSLEVKLAMRHTYASAAGMCARIRSFPFLSSLENLKNIRRLFAMSIRETKIILFFLLITHPSQFLSSLFLPPPPPRLRAKSCPPTPPPAIPNPFSHPPGPPPLKESVSSPPSRHHAPKYEEKI